jgi:hypothetical protein
MKFIALAATLVILVSLVLYLVKKSPKQIVQEEMVVKPSVKKKKVYKKKSKEE